ncbi:MAG TPA: reverse transcriptase family protein [Pirellulales bacterium]|nr:reverse transcriptase family protein [Pirellulales bacterium]
MGLFNWLIRILTGTSNEPPRAGRPDRTTAAPNTIVRTFDVNDLNRPTTPGVVSQSTWQPPPSAPAPAPSVAPGRPSQTSWQRPQEKPPVTLAGLDASQFAPLSGDEVKKQARGLGSRWGNPWFGRRDLIPPASDPRTELIDRAMVAHGLLTPEDLVEIHRVGDEMERIRPDLAQASVIAAAEVARSREEREALKQRKKAEAAERKRRRVEEVARRRAADIIFLGRGVSRGLADRRANVKKLQQAGLPVLASPADVAQALSLTIPRLRWLAFHSQAPTRTHYIRFTVPKKNGGVRELTAPHRDLARAQQWVLQNILAKVPVHELAQGFVSGRSTVTNATRHVGRAVVINVDLKDFFPSITFPRVKGVFQELGYSPAAATVLALLATESPRRTVEYAGLTYHAATGPRALPQGACTSPALSNLVARRLDARLSGIAARLGWTYSRYADDLTFSAPAEAAHLAGYLLARIRHIAADEGFTVNESKTRVQRQNASQRVTGIVVNRRSGVPRRHVRRIRAILHRAKREGLAAQNRAGRPNFDAWLRGMIAYIEMVNPDQARPLKAAYEALQPH